MSVDGKALDVGIAHLGERRKASQAAQRYRATRFVIATPDALHLRHARVSCALFLFLCQTRWLSRTDCACARQSALLEQPRDNGAAQGKSPESSRHHPCPYCSTPARSPPNHQPFTCQCQVSAHMSWIAQDIYGKCSSAQVCTWQATRQVFARGSVSAPLG